MKIFIDAGHNYGKWNTGSEGNGLREQDITFYIAEKLSQKLKAVNVEVMMSRNKVTDILGTGNDSSLSARVNMANNWNADLFISIHCNSAVNKSATGTETLVYSKKSKSYALAEKITKAISNDLSLKNRGVKVNSTLAVLRRTTMPSLLVETAFICNVNDAQKLKDRQDDFAEAIFKEICEHYGIKKKPQEDKPESATYHIEGERCVVCGTRLRN